MREVRIDDNVRGAAYFVASARGEPEYKCAENLDSFACSDVLKSSFIMEPVRYSKFTVRIPPRNSFRK